MSNLFVSGYQVVDRIVSSEDCDALTSHLPPDSKTGSRTVLSNPAIAKVVEGIRACPDLAAVVEDLIAVQCIYFRKTREHNWSLSMHRDASLAIDGDSREWGNPFDKEGLQFVHPPREFMDRCLAVRLAIDSVPEGDVQVIPGSHRTDSCLADTAEAVDPDVGQIVTPVVQRCGALAMRPTILHGSSRLRISPSRRVLHYIFAPNVLPKGYRWYHAF